jgi:hypothetical protein
MAKYPKGPRVKVEVTQAIIDAAIVHGQRDSRHCMISEAVQRAFPGAAMVSTDLATVRFSEPAKHLRYTYMTPRVAQVQLVKFDQGVKPEPFEFTLKHAHVTRSGSSPATKVRQARARAKAKGQPAPEAVVAVDLAAPDMLRRAALRGGGVATGAPVPVGGRTPPVQMTKDGVPFSRRRAFGLRALEL